MDFAPPQGETHPGNPDSENPRRGSLSDEHPSSDPGSEPAPPLGMRGPSDDGLEDTFKRTVTYIDPGGDRPIGRDKSVFNSGGSEAFEAVIMYMPSRGLSGFGETFNGFDEGVKVPQELDQEHIDYLSAAFARRSSGEAFVFLTKEGLSSATTFTPIEREEY